MFKILVEKELKSILQSPKFVATFGVCSLLILLSVFIGIQEYHSSVDQYETATQLVDQSIAEATSFFGIENTVYRKPSPMQIFVSGVSFDVGRLSKIDSREDVKLERSSYMESPLFAVFRFVDFTFIVQVVLSLFAILFTFDAINGERESGTLKLALSNPIPRGQYLFSKFVGSWLGLTVPLMIPILIGVLLLMVLNVPMTGDDWAKLVSLIGVSILYFTFFIALSLLVSSLTRRSSVSFLVLLVVWIALVLIVPRGATMAAGQLVSVPTVAENESQKDRFRTDQQQLVQERRQEAWKNRFMALEGASREEKRAYYDANKDAWDQEDREVRTEMEVKITEFNRKMNEALRNAKSEQERLAFILSRFSPSSAYQLTAMNLGGTNTSIKKRYEDQMFAYRESFSGYLKTKQEDEREERRRQAEQSGSGRRLFMFLGSGGEPVDASDMPEFIEPRESLSAVLKPSMIDFGLLSIFTVFAFAGAFIAFIRYDVR
ncbi:MAG: hypothetical protein BMS9Abin05_1322 [Rhodothermia bacterium]|nr:MAG: hypothetical protein BMS9Abin05_1322 [Rhodothermia bacterium]